MAPTPEWIWYDGRLIPAAEATTHVLTHSLHYGVSLIEGIRAYQADDGTSHVFRLAAHLDRLALSAAAYRMALPFTKVELLSAHRDLLVANGCKQGYVRPIAFFGTDQFGMLPTGNSSHVAIAILNFGSYHGRDAVLSGIRMKTASFTRPAPSSTLNRAKVSALYANSILAKQEVVADGFDEALLLDSLGFVAEASAENVFLVKNGQLIDVESPCALLGITRSTVIELAKDRGIDVVSRRVTRDDLYQCDELFLTGTASEVVPVVELDRRKIGAGVPGPCTCELVKAYADAVRGRDAKHQDWLTRVPLDTVHS